uniref:Sperm microtubule inner protein 1 C-terminal domain-containing protein n=1 Tax=Neobodo designis TaxID=312471 RepID=A0A7S1PP34_NEODS|mmetsp:Transcript_13927/g.43375  ORF Transcript_13927/g.43375 Transcript_13927/m.43375 type:complete len:164 (+) Transcript_13927:74-565(+)
MGPVKDLQKEPAMTVAMGMKLTQTSQECWRVACSKEARIRDEWVRTYMPELERREKEIAQRYNEREAERHAKALATKERQLLLDGVSKDGKGRIAYLKARRNLTPQERFGDATVTASQEAGWRVMSQPAPERIPGMPSYGRKPVIKNGFFRRTIGGSLTQAIN